jgi:hypothetical protein
MRRGPHPTWKKKVGGFQSTRGNSGLDTLPCLLRYFELHGPLSLSLDDYRPGCSVTSLTDVLHTQSRQVARPELAVDREAT